MATPKSLSKEKSTVNFADIQAATNHDLFDRDGDSVITREEMLKVAKNIEQVYKKFDVDNKGTITAQEFQEGLTKIGVLLQPSEYRQLFERFDVNNDGKINYKEFLLEVPYPIIHAANRHAMGKSPSPIVAAGQPDVNGLVAPPHIKEIKPRKVEKRSVIYRSMANEYGEWQPRNLEQPAFPLNGRFTDHLVQGGMARYNGFNVAKSRSKVTRDPSFLTTPWFSERIC